MKLAHEFDMTLVCPQCRIEVAHVADAYICRSADCRRSYPIVDGIPKFLIDDARILSPEEWAISVSSRGERRKN